MARTSFRRTLKLERLETRQVLSAMGTTPDQQYALELINLTRTNPSAAADRFSSNLSADVKATLAQYNLTADSLKSKMSSATPMPALAYNDALSATAQAQSQYEADNGVQSHIGANGANLSTRLSNAGYTGFNSAGENTYAYAVSVDEAMQSFLYDWGVADDGHYGNLLQPGTSAQNAYNEVGVGLVNTSGKGVGPMVVTQDFGNNPNTGPQILGVIYNDSNHDNFYEPGEGLGGATIDAVNLTTGKDYQIQSWQSGGYQVPVDPNADYKVTATVNGQVVQTEQVHVGSTNQKVDFVLNGTPAPVAQAVAAPAPAPVATPAPSPAPTSTPAQLDVSAWAKTQADQTKSPVDGWASWNAPVEGN